MSNNSPSEAAPTASVVLLVMPISVSVPQSFCM
jgi:hypothetical protein